MSLLNNPSEKVQTATPQQILRDDRAVAAATAAGLGIFIGAAAAVVAGIPAGAAAAYGTVIAAPVAGTSWGWFVIARACLALRGRLPLRLMTLLHDAHRRGVLRQAGSAYQFRHLRLQERLAARGQPAVSTGTLRGS